MSELRQIRKVVQRRATIEGAGVRLRRVIGFGQPELYDPFLLLDDFRSDDPDDYLAGFPWHPHRGIETITYVLRGDVEHGDSLGNRGVISTGDVQWMTAGSGIIHQEMPKGDAAGAMHGFQLWANLPAAHKMIDPRYRGFTAAELPEVSAAGTRAKVIAGRVSDVTGPVRDVVIQPELLDVSVPPGQTFSHVLPRGHTAFAYVIGGQACFAGQPGTAEGTSRADLERGLRLGDGYLALFGDGDEVAISAGMEPARFLLIAGQPIGEPIAWRGPIVMNTQEELRLAFEELQQDTFIKSGKRPG
jgi:redox-sensitive bicupin YhaK (pirin superfamily)